MKESSRVILTVALMICITAGFISYNMSHQSVELEISGEIEHKHIIENGTIPENYSVIFPSNHTVYFSGDANLSKLVDEIIKDYLNGTNFTDIQT